MEGLKEQLTRDSVEVLSVATTVNDQFESVTHVSMNLKLENTFNLRALHGEDAGDQMLGKMVRKAIEAAQVRQQAEAVQKQAAYEKFQQQRDA